MLESSSLALVSAHQLAEMAKSKNEQKYIFFLLKKWAQTELMNGKQQDGARMLRDLLELDKMQYSNVSLRNLLDYLALQWKR